MVSTHASLLLRVRRHADAAAWEAFEGRYGPLVLAYAMRLGLGLADAEDVRQDVFVSLSKALTSFSYDPTVGTFRGYLRSVVRHAVSRRVGARGGRHGTHAARLFDADGPAGGDGAEDQEWERQWRRHHCQLAMEALRRSESERNVEVFTMLLAGADAGQVGAALGLSPEAVRKIKQRVRERLREIIGAQLRDEEERGGRGERGGSSGTARENAP